MIVPSCYLLSQKEFEAALNTLPADPHRLTIRFFDVDYSPLADQLRTIPYLKDAAFGFDHEVCSEHPLNLAVIKNPTKQKVIDLYGHKWRKPNVLGVEFWSAEWNFSNPLYHWNPNKNAFGLQEGNRFPEYPSEIKLEEAIENAEKPYKELLRDYSDRSLIEADKIIKKEFLPSSSVVITMDNVSVTYGIREPGYLPALVKALEGSGALTIQRYL
ncbi:MAG TPA: hypothetical protein VJA18_06295 [Candidatus Nanoarchaeia archaeon]|nr:hypothetical protein [Candidatus Nanoarchaeia archaeon]